MHLLCNKQYIIYLLNGEIIACRSTFTRELLAYGRSPGFHFGICCEIILSDLITLEIVHANCAMDSNFLVGLNVFSLVSQYVEMSRMAAKIVFIPMEN